MWAIGFADRPRFPRFPSKRGKREMLAFANMLFMHHNRQAN
jgi:hypothetical protein